MMSDNAENHNRRLPLWVLNSHEEKEARQNLKKYAYAQCVEYVEAMAECSKLHGIKLFPACYGPRDAMRNCIWAHQSDAELDEQRDLMVQRRIQRLEENLKKQKENQTK